MNLVIDLGNTFFKVGTFEGFEIKTFHKFRKNETKQLIRFLEELNFENSILASVINTPEKLSDFLKFRNERFLEFGSDTKLPLKNAYKSPESLGKDRLALANGAWMMFPGENVLVIDAGSCVTFDFVSCIGEYLGGSICPGLEMRFQALNSFTDKLPMVSHDPLFIDFVGDNTINSIRAGVQAGLLSELNGMINLYKEKFPEIKIILSGGDTNYLSAKLKNCNFASENFLLYSLNQILLFNV